MSALLENDMAAARAEARGQYGSHANAEELIRAHTATISPEVRAASKKALNEEATRTLDRSKIEVPEGGKLVDAVVRGNTISFIWEDSTGAWHKAACGYDDSYEGADEPASEALSRALAEQAVETREQAIDWQAEMDAKVAELRTQLQTEHAEQLAELRSQHKEQIESLQKKAEEEATKAKEAKPTAKPRSSGGAKGKAAGARSKSQQQMDDQQNKRKVAEG